MVYVPGMRTYSKLNAIQEDAQRVAEAISSSLELETEIVGETVAAMIVEPIQGEAGIVLAAAELLKAVTGNLRPLRGTVDFR